MNADDKKWLKTKSEKEVFDLMFKLADATKHMPWVLEFLETIIACRKEIKAVIDALTTAGATAATHIDRLKALLPEEVK